MPDTHRPTCPARGSGLYRVYRGGLLKPAHFRKEVRVCVWCKIGACLHHGRWIWKEFRHTYCLLPLPRSNCFYSLLLQFRNVDILLLLSPTNQPTIKGENPDSPHWVCHFKQNREGTRSCRTGGGDGRCVCVVVRMKELGSSRKMCCTHSRRQRWKKWERTKELQHTTILDSRRRRRFRNVWTALEGERIDFQLQF